MARSKRKQSTRAKAAPAAAASGSEHLEDLTLDEVEESKDAKEAADKGSRAHSRQDPVRKKHPSTSSATGELGEKAKDASRSTSPKKSAAAESARSGRGRRVAATSQMNPQWLVPTAVTLLIVGLVYLVTYYLSAGTLPLPIGDWNLAAGFGLIMLGGGMFMFWK